MAALLLILALLTALATLATGLILGFHEFKQPSDLYLAGGVLLAFGLFQCGHGVHALQHGELVARGHTHTRAEGPRLFLLQALLLWLVALAAVAGGALLIFTAYHS